MKDFEEEGPWVIELEGKAIEIPSCIAERIHLIMRNAAKLSMKCPNCVGALVPRAIDMALLGLVEVRDHNDSNGTVEIRPASRVDTVAWSHPKAKC